MDRLIAIDATNLNAGGGITHLVNYLLHSDPLPDSTHIYIWARPSTLRKLPSYPWLTKRSNFFITFSGFTCLFWSYIVLPVYLRIKQFDILFAPGGSQIGLFHPVVTMSRNILPFSIRETCRYGFRLITLRLLLLRLIQTLSFVTCDGLIFLTPSAKDYILKRLPFRPKRTVVIPHGVSAISPYPRAFMPISSFSEANPFNIIYVSDLHPYKHHLSLIKATAQLRVEYSFPLHLHLIGALHSSTKNRLDKLLRSIPDSSSWIHFHGHLSTHEISALFSSSHISVFASTCENLPNILLEYMAAGLPIVCSSYPPMPSITRNAAVYFNPLSHASLELALYTLITNPSLRSTLSARALSSSSLYKWVSTARDTNSFLNSFYV